MKLYYRAVSPDGKSMKGIIEAKDAREAAYYLRQHKFTPIKIIPASHTGIRHFFPFLNKSSFTDRIFFTRQIASMLTSGLTLMQALQIVKDQSPNPIMSEITQTVISDVQNGKTFSQALEKHQKEFSPIYISLIRTAESSGLLDSVLTRLADNMEKQQKLQKTIKSALLYPAVVVFMMVVVMIVMMTFVVPQLTSLYSNLSLSLPLPTRIVIGISEIFAGYWYVGLICIAIGAYYFRQWYKGEFGRRVVDGYLLKMPVFGKLISQTMMAEITRTLGLLIGAGSLVIESLTRSSGVVNNVLYKDAIILVAKRVEKGITMGDAMEASPLFPPVVVEMVKIGEQTGKLDESLLKASEYFEREVEETVKNLTTLIEPIIMVILALGVGFLVFAVITPIYNLISSLG